MSQEALRAAVDAALAEQEGAAVRSGLRRLFQEAPNLGNAQFVLTRLAKWENRPKMTDCRVAFLRSFTVEPAIPLLRAAAGLHEIDVTAQVGEFNTYVQDILDPNSALYAFEPQVVVVAVQTRDLFPALWNGDLDLTPEGIKSLIAQASQDFATWMDTFRQRSSAHLVIHNFEVPVAPSAGVYDFQTTQSQVAAIQDINRELARLAAERSGVYVLDYDGLVARHGRQNWRDARKWLTARMPIRADYLIYLAQEWLRFLLPITGKVCKALVVDLDNTLWGGVIGEDGMQGIQIGTEYPGAAFRELQRAILDLYKRGVILAVCSKNNLADAMEALEKREGMILRPQHFAALRINWQDKAQNLREIAAELNIGIDSLAFLDDNPVERQQVGLHAPEVFVIDLPSDPMEYAQTLRNCPVFERLTLSSEDRERGRFYAEQRERADLERSATSIEDFYRSLKMEAEIAPVNADTLARTAQLTQKTNQFNMTTRRYSEQEISERIASPDWEAYTLRVSDRFGDNGLVGVALLRYEGAGCEIDTLLMSCRVIGRTVETALLATLTERAQVRGAQTLRGWFLPTKKNPPAQDFYPKHDFCPVEKNAEGTLWELDIAARTVACPEWILRK